MSVFLHETARAWPHCAHKPIRHPWNGFVRPQAATAEQIAKAIVKLRKTKTA